MKLIKYRYQLSIMYVIDKAKNTISFASCLRKCMSTHITQVRMIKWKIMVPLMLDWLVMSVQSSWKTVNISSILVIFMCILDAYEKNNKLIQYNAMYTVYLLVKQNGVWQFPNTAVEDKETFQETKNKFFAQLSNNLWEVKISENQIYYFNRKPRFVTADENPKGKVKGVKTYHFQALHIKGKV